jgi:hypothetical protein
MRMSIVDFPMGLHTSGSQPLARSYSSDGADSSSGMDVLKIGQALRFAYYYSSVRFRML